jgi:hypothetical protein
MHTNHYLGVGFNLIIFLYLLLFVTRTWAIINIGWRVTLVAVLLAKRLLGIIKSFL